MGLINSLKKMCDKFQTDGLTLSEKAVYKFIKEIDSGIYDDMFWGEENGVKYELQFFNNEHLFNEIIVYEIGNPYENDYGIISRLILDSRVRYYLKRKLYESVAEAEKRNLARKEKEFEEEQANELEEYLYENNK